MELIVAVDADTGIIGINGKMPWHIPEDMKHFRAITEGHIIIMGRKTLDSFPGSAPLKNRIHIVLTRSPPPAQLEKTRTYYTTYEQLPLVLKRVQTENPDKRTFVIGGSEIYDLLWDQCVRFHITLISANIPYDADKSDQYARFPIKKLNDLPLLAEANSGLLCSSVNNIPYRFMCYSIQRG